MKSELFKDFINVSNKVGLDSAFVQGGGGNTSLKTDSNEMYIKASGYSLKDMKLDDGFCVVNCQSVRSYLHNFDFTGEDDFTDKIKSFKTRTNLRPSIETGFHAVLGRCVIHTHSVYSNILTCSKEGMSLSKELFPKSIWVNYASPGSQLTLKVMESIHGKDFGEDIVIFLQNHGLIVSSVSPERALELHTYVNDKIRAELSLKDFNDTNSGENSNFEVLNQGVLFPDQVVYTVADQSVLGTEAAIDTLRSYKYILGNINNLKLAPLFLSSNDADLIKNMESEKYRLGVLKNAHHSASN